MEHSVCIRGRKANSSASPDGLPAEFFKNTFISVVFPLYHYK